MEAIKIKIFLAAPISGFLDEKQYETYKHEIIELINFLSSEYEVFSEIQCISGIETYDSPEDSLKKDFELIRMSDIFIFLHPMRMQTSTLIELGFACALKKPLLIVGEKKALPYMALGLNGLEHRAIFVYSSIINNKTMVQIKEAIDSLSNNL